MRRTITHDADYDLELQHEREADDAREQRWTVFVADVKAAKIHALGGWSGVVRTVGDAMDYRYSVTLGSFEHRCQDFAESEGWSGVLTAVARAIREKACAQ